MSRLCRISEVNAFVNHVYSSRSQGWLQCIPRFASNFLKLLADIISYPVVNSTLIQRSGRQDPEGVCLLFDGDLELAEYTVDGLVLLLVTHIGCGIISWPDRCEVPPRWIPWIWKGLSTMGKAHVEMQS
jgi:hypothetical protein